MSAQNAHTADSGIVTKTIELANSTLTFARTPAGTVARVNHDSGCLDFAGPLDDDTIAALREAGR